MRVDIRFEDEAYRGRLAYRCLNIAHDIKHLLSDTWDHLNIEMTNVVANQARGGVTGWRK